MNEEENILDELNDGHAIVSVDTASKICEALWLKLTETLIKRWYSDPPGTPEGLTMYEEGSEGVWILELTYDLCGQLGIEAPGHKFSGRGSQARANYAAIREELKRRNRMEIKIGEQVVAIDDVDIPDLWHVGTYLRDHGQEAAAQAVIDTWHYALAMKRKLQELDKKA